jgi:integrase
MKLNRNSPKAFLYLTGRPIDGRPQRKVWQVRAVVNGKRRCWTVGEHPEMGKRDAEVERRKIQSTLDTGGRVVETDIEGMTLRQMFTHYRDTIAFNVRPRTLIEYENAVDHADRVLAGVVVLKIDKAAVGRLKSHLRVECKHADATIRKTLARLSGLCAVAVDDEKLARNPFRGTTAGKVTEGDPHPFDGAEVQAMLADLDKRIEKGKAEGAKPGHIRDAEEADWWRLFILTTLTAGLRCGEAVHLQWADIDLDAGTIRVRPKSAETITVAGEQYRTLPFDVKDHDARTVPTLTPEAISALQRAKAKAGGNPYVFIPLARLRAVEAAQTAGKWRADTKVLNNLNRAFDALQARVGVKPLRTIQSLRETFAT